MKRPKRKVCHTPQLARFSLCLHLLDSLSVLGYPQVYLSNRNRASKESFLDSKEALRSDRRVVSVVLGYFEVRSRLPSISGENSKL